MTNFEAYDLFLRRNLDDLDAAARTVTRGGFCRPEEGEDVAYVLGLVMMGRIRWRGRWEEGLQHLDGSMQWTRPAGVWNRLLFDLERVERRIVLDAVGTAVLRMDEPPPDAPAYIVVPRVD